MAGALGQRGLDGAGGGAGARERDAGDPAVFDQRRPHHFTASGQPLHHVAGQAGFVHQPHRAPSDQWRLFRRLGHHGVAGGQRRGHLPGEDGQGKVPRRDAGEHAASVQSEDIALARGPRQRLAAAEAGHALTRVVAAEVHRLADFGQRVRHRLAGFPNQQRGEFGAVPLVKVAKREQLLGAPFGRRRVPTRLRRRGQGEGRIELGRARLPRQAHHVIVPRWVANRLAVGGSVPTGFAEWRHFAAQRVRLVGALQVQAARVHAPFAKQGRRGRNERVARALPMRHVRHRVAHHLVQAHLGV